MKEVIRLATQAQLDEAVKQANDPRGKRLNNSQRHDLQRASRQAGPFGRRAEQALQSDDKK